MEINEQDLRRLENDLNNVGDALEKMLERAALEIKVGYKVEILAADAYETGELYNSIISYTDNPREIFIVSDVGYGAVVEFGRKDRPNYEAHKLANEALDYMDAQDLIETLTTSAFDEILQR